MADDHGDPRPPFWRLTASANAFNDFLRFPAFDDQLFGHHAASSGRTPRLGPSWDWQLSKSRRREEMVNGSSGGH